jgi:hypothetical protein
VVAPLCAVILLTVAVPAFPADPAAPAEKGGADEESFWDNFIDDEDGALDLSNWLEHPAGFLPLVIPVTEPAVGFGPPSASSSSTARGRSA